MFGRIGSGIVGGVSMICTLKYLKEQKEEKRDAERKLKACTLENEYLKKKISRLEEEPVIDDKERREDNLEFMKDFDNLMDVVSRHDKKMDKDYKRFKKIDKKINKTIEKNRKELDKLMEELEIDME